MATNQARKVDFWTKFKVMTTFPGDWESIFKGEGDEFFDLREYVPGDDYRKIHWASLARTGKLFLRENIARRELRVYVILDMGPSMFFHEKQEYLNAILAVTGVSAIRSAVPLGFLAFDGEPFLFFPARPGKSAFFEVMTWFLQFRPRPEYPTAFSDTLIRFIFEKVPRRSLVFLISDFLSPSFSREMLSPLARMYDLIPVVVRDRFETDFPLEGEVAIRDMFSHDEMRVMMQRKERMEFRAYMAQNLQELTSLFKEKLLDFLVLDSPRPERVFEELAMLFRIRRGRKRRVLR